MRQPHATAALVFTLLACTDPRIEVERGVLTVSQEQQSAWMRNFNPLLAPGISRWPTTGGVYEPLLVFNAMTGEYQPWLALGYEWSDDMRRLTFRLRAGVSWSDGAAFDADDVAFTFDLLREHPALDLHGVWGFVAGVEAADEGTVVFELARPFSPGLYRIAHQPIVPEHLWRDIDNPVAFANPTPVGTGPFTEVEVFRNQVYQLGRNPHYWQPGRPAVRSLRFPAYPTNDQAMLALVNGEVDWAGNFVPAIERTYVARDPEHRGYWYPLAGQTIMLYANTARSPLSDARLRKAISMAIDRDLLVKVAMYGTSVAADATGLAGVHAAWRDPLVAASSGWTRYDLAAANQLLDRAGYLRGDDGTRRTPAGMPLSWQLTTVTGWSDWARAAQVIARSVRPLGIEVTVRTYDFALWFDRLQRGHFDLSLGWTEDGPTPYFHFRGLMSATAVQAVGEPAAANWHRHGSARADSLLGELAATADPAEQRRITSALQREFASSAPAIPLFPNPMWGAYTTTRFTGFPSADDPYARLSPNYPPETLLVLTRLEPR